MSMKVLKEQPILELSDIVMQFASRDGTLFNPKKFTAVDNVSLSIYAGETVGLVGQSGCGKSTLASIMIGLQKPTSGTVKFNGLQMKYGSTEARKQFGRQVSVIFQDPATALNPRMRVLDILKDPMDIHNVLQPHEREKRVYELLSRVGLPRSAALVEPTRLSGGQKQRLSIARAIAKEPEIFVFDDSFSALDYKTDAKLREALAEKTQNKTVIIVAQRINTVLNADQIIVLDDGKIAGKGTHKELMQNCEVYKQIALSQLSAEELE